MVRDGSFVPATVRKRFKLATFTVKEFILLFLYCIFSFVIKKSSEQKLELSILHKLKEIKSSGSEYVIKLLDFFFLDDNQDNFYLVFDYCNVCLFYYLI